MIQALRSQFGSRRPILLAIALVMVVLYPTWSLITIYSQANQVASQKNRERANELINVAQEANLFLKDGQFKQLEDRLQNSLEFNEFDAISVRRASGEAVVVLDPLSLLPGLPVPKREHILYAGSITYLEYETDGYVVRIASRDVTEKFFWRFIKENIFLLLRDVAIVLLMSGFTVSYFIKDIAQILFALRSGNDGGLQSGLKTVQSRSAEGATLLKSIQTMNLSLAELEAQNRQLRNQVLPALNSELMSGRKPPYEFDCTLVRVDVNNFSHIFTNYPVEDFMSVINVFFEDVTEIVSRYRGYVYEFVGDEVIFYFKDEEQRNSVATALASLRDINEAAVRLDARVKQEQGYNFRVKSALAHGRLRFGPQVTGFSLAGAILIETVRILSQISDKEDNVIFYDEALAQRVSYVVESRQQKIVMLKGLSSSRSLYSYVSFLPLEDALNRISADDSDVLGLYRSDRDLRVLLQTLRVQAQTMDVALFLSICRKLRLFKVPRVSKTVVNAYHSLLETLVTHCESATRTENDLFRLSSSLTLAIHLLDADSFTQSLKPLYKTCLSFSDRRVVANSLDVFVHFSQFDEDVTFHELLKHKDNRVAANALVKEGQKGLSRLVVKRIAKMLEHKDPRFVASALYVIGELAQHHRAKNAIHYETNTGFKALVHRLRHYVGHHDEMVRRQSLIAARKTQDEASREAIETFYLNEANPQIKAEIETFFLKSRQAPASGTASKSGAAA